jgi:GNAT superfamily N-acetyltransferase
MATRLRPLTQADEGALAEFLAGLSLRSFTFRFFSAGVNPQRAAHEVVQVDGHDRIGVIAEDDDGRIVGHAMYARSKPNAVESAFAVADDMQGHGLGSVMVAYVAQLAHENGFEILEAEVMPENHRMLDVFAESGLPLHLRAEPGVVHVSADLSGDSKWETHSLLDTTVRTEPGKRSITRLPG